MEDNYSLGKELGRGGFGVVHQATKKSGDDSTPYAVKSILKYKLPRNVEKNLIQTEIKIMHKLKGHPGIVSLHETYEDRGHVHMIMEFCGGGELLDRIIELADMAASYSEADASNVCKSILQMLEHCHGHNIIHRDLKPENFLFLNKNDDSPIKLTDFGLSTFYDGTPLTQKTGTIHYAAPEVLGRWIPDALFNKLADKGLDGEVRAILKGQGGNAAVEECFNECGVAYPLGKPTGYGPKCDVWSVGVIAFALLTGEFPFYSDDQHYLAQIIQSEPADPDGSILSSLSDSARDFLGKILDKDPEKRLSAQAALGHPWICGGEATKKPLDNKVLSALKKFGANSKFKKKALQLVADRLELDKMEALKKIFRDVDKDGGGTLCVSEFTKAVHDAGLDGDEAEMTALMQSVDCDGDGKINYNEFAAALVHMHIETLEEQLYSTFCAMDTDGNGVLDKQEIEHVLRDENKGLKGHDEATELAKKTLVDCDADGNGTIDYQEFLRMMTGGKGAAAGEGTDQGWMKDVFGHRSDALENPPEDAGVAAAAAAQAAKAEAADSEAKAEGEASPAEEAAPAEGE